MSARAFALAASSPIHNVVILGAGYMGTGIAQVAASAGYNVTLVDKHKEHLDKACSKIPKELHQKIKRETTLATAVKNADLVVEVIDEDLQEKQKLLEDLDKNAKSSAIFATNTESIKFKDLAKNIQRKDRFAGLCFDDPVEKTRSLRVVKLPESSEQVIQALQEFGKKLGKSTTMQG